MSVCSSAVVVRGSLILAVRISRADSSRHSSRVLGSLSFPLHMVSKLATVSDQGSPPSSSSRRSRDKSGDVSRSERDSSLPLAYMVSKLTTVSNLCSPPSSSSSGARDKSGNVSRGHRYSSLPLTHMVSDLASVGNLCSPPGSSSRRSRDKSRNVSRNYGVSSLASSQGNQRQGDDLGEHVE